MRRSALTAIAVAALLVPGTALAQSPSPGSPSPGTSPGQDLIGVDTMDVCLAIRGPVTLLDAESLTQGIIDGTFVIEGLSTECDTQTGQEPGASPTVIDTIDEPEASPAGS